VQRAAEAADVAGGKQRKDVVESGDARRAGSSGCAAEEIFLRGHLEDGADVLRHAAVDDDEGLGSSWRAASGMRSTAEEGMTREKPTAADTVLRDRRVGPSAPSIEPDAGQSRRSPANRRRSRRSHSPRMARAATMRRSAFRHLAGAASDLRRWRACRRRSGRRGGWWIRRGATPWDAVDVADEFEATTGAEDGGEELGEAGSRALDPGWNEAGGDEGGLQQAEVIAAEIKNLVERGEAGGGFEVDAGEADDGFVDDAETLRRVGAGRRRGRGPRGRWRCRGRERPRGNPCRERECWTNRTRCGRCAPGCVHGAVGANRSPAAATSSGRTRSDWSRG